MLKYSSSCYDNEAKVANLLSNEALISLSVKLRNELSEDYFKFYCISKSIKRVKRKFFIQH